MTHPITRRKFLQHLALVTLPWPQQTSGGPTDWDQETELARSVREYLESVFSGRNMTLDFRRINERYDQEFRIQIKAFDWMPVASCFKAWMPLYYYLNTPPGSWDDQPGSSLYSTVVFSSNLDTGIVLADVANRIAGDRNPIEKFNDFLRETVGMANGLYTWDWTGSPTVGFVDQRYEPTLNRAVKLETDDEVYLADNIFTANDLAHGYDVLVRGEVFARWDRMREAITATRALLNIRAPEYRSPLEFVVTDGYMGKDGILPAEDFQPGRVVNDAGVITIGEAHYIIAFFSAGESEVSVRSVLGELMTMIDIYERGRRTLTPPSSGT